VRNARGSISSPFWTGRPKRDLSGEIPDLSYSQMFSCLSFRRRCGRFCLWSTVLFGVAIAQGQPGLPAKWCFERGQQGAQLCEDTEAECIKLRSINTEIATSPCKHIDRPEIQQSPSEPPTPEQQTPTQRR
jgi:hypothetical protein